MASDGGRYVYCIIECDRRISFGNIGIGGLGGEVYTIPYKDISAVISNTPLKEYEPNEENALAHMNVIHKVMEEHTVLPMRFCTIFKGEDGLKKALARLYEESRSELRRLNGKVEAGVKVLWPPNIASTVVKETSRLVKALEQEIQEKTQGIAYLLRVKMNDAIKDELNRRSEEYAESIYNRLKSHSIDSHQSRLIGHMILNGAFLLEKDRMESFRQVAESLRREYESQGLEFIFSGPWPPYNFVTIKYG